MNRQPTTTSGRRGLLPGAGSLSLLLACGVLLPASALRVAGQAGNEPVGFARVEQWACPAENRAGFRDYVDSVWAPLFDEMTREGLFTSWSDMEPVDVRDVDFRAEGASVQQVMERWSWVGVWRAATQEELDAAWREYHRRLSEVSPTGSGPEALCSSVRIATYHLR